MYNRTAYILAESPLKKDLYKLFRKNAELVILDIGGCEGEDSIKYSRLFPKASIFIFEPLPKNQERIRANLHDYQTQHIELIPVALSDQKGEYNFYVSSGHPGDKENNLDWDFGNKSSSLLPPDKHTSWVPWVKFDEVINVPTMSLADFFSSKNIRGADFIHMDVQGAELKVLTGAGENIRHVKAIWLEVADLSLYQGQPLRTDIETFMKDHGFYLAKSAMDGQCGDQLYLNSRNFKTYSFFNNMFSFHKRTDRS